MGTVKRIIRFSVIAFIVYSLPLLAQESFTLYTVPNPKAVDNTWVSDPGQNLSDSDRQRINELLDDLERDTSAEVVVVILPSIGDEVPKDFAVDLFQHWGIGKQMKDNGLLLLIVLDQRTWELETGYGLEGQLPDVTLKRLGEDRLVPHLREDRMGEGIYQLLSAIAEELYGASADTAIHHTGPGSTGGNVSEGVLPMSEEMVAELDREDYEMSNILGLSYEERTLLTILTIVYAAIVVIVVTVLFVRSGKKSKTAGGRHYAKLALFWLLPGLVLLTVFYFRRPEWFLYFYYPVGALGAGALRAFKNHTILKKDSDPYRTYQELRQGHKIPFFLSIWLFPIPMGLFALYYFFKLRSLRYAPRKCPSCLAELERLDEKADDLFLDAGQRKEEMLGSVDYDVWHCDRCDHVKVFPYDSFFTSYHACPSCEYKTYHTVADRTLVSPTCHSSGKGERDYRCEHCGHTDTQSYTIPRRDCSKSSTSSGGSSYRSGGGSSFSSGSGSFGGGSSGGGGAGGTW